MKLIAACAFGLEAVVKRELADLGYAAAVSQPGRVRFEGDWAAICEANLWLRSADRVLIEVQEFPAPDFDALFETVRDGDWAALIPAEGEFPVAGKSNRSQLTSVPAIQRTVKKALVESLRRGHGVAALPEEGGRYRVEVALLDDVASLTLDTTGPGLHRRGYREEVANGALKETLAAALVQLSVWQPDRPLLDPFCGSGTIAIEAALLGRRLAPGMNREFASSRWSTLSQKLWDDARQQARARRQEEGALQIMGTDLDGRMLESARQQARRAGVEADIHFQQRDFEDLLSRREYGCLITCPPLLERPEDRWQLEPLYTSLPAVLQRLPTWSFFLFTNYPGLERTWQRRATRRRKLFNGRLEGTYYQFLGPKPPSLQRPATASGPEVEGPADSAELTPPVTDRADATVKARAPAAPVFGGVQAKGREQAELFRSRLVKRSRHLRRWPSRRGITCYRLYDRDIPEIPLVVDRYEDSLHITEYERPHDRDLAGHGAWLELMKKTAAAALEVPMDRVHLKQRRKTGPAPQYRKLDQQQRMKEVSEGGLKFLVNLTDYVDTGLFLDHRVTRGWVRERAAGTRFLNLFAYTGSFTVYAAAGGAAETTTVDLSTTYLEWALQNLRLNGLGGPQHRFMAGDSLEFLEQAASEGRQFDLAVVDPPTYSNSKRTERDWSVQEQYPELLAGLAKVMPPGGVAYFSTNFRKFKFSPEDVPDFEPREVSNQSVPEDFRNRRIHRCWWLERRG